MLGAESESANAGYRLRTSLPTWENVRLDARLNVWIILVGTLPTIVCGRRQRRRLTIADDVETPSS
jgi:hypothetical protein